MDRKKAVASTMLAIPLRKLLRNVEDLFANARLLRNATLRLHKAAATETDDRMTHRKSSSPSDVS
jgi:hypothetical protein